MPVQAGDRYQIESPQPLVAALRQAGFRIVGPQASDGAIVYEELDSSQSLPRGLTDEQSGGHYRLKNGDPNRWFDYVVGPQSWKKHMFPAHQKLWSAARTSDGFDINPSEDEYPKTAFFGVRACEIAAMQIQDKVFDNGQFADSGYGRRRAATLIVAVQCARSAETCFCASMNTGPRADSGFDIALTELETGGFLVECGSEAGGVVLEGLALSEATDADWDAAKAATDKAAAMQTRKMVGNVAEVLREHLDHPRWDEVADRCLSCANCTLACPTCFCSDVEEVTDLSGEHAERWRVWDSCFSLDFSYIHGGAVRTSTKSRYRQWMTHKLSSWHDQFDTSGCVGCGRCIAWCPVGIDITEEAEAMATPMETTEG